MGDYRNGVYRLSQQTEPEAARAQFQYRNAKVAHDPIMHFEIRHRDKKATVRIFPCMCVIEQSGLDTEGRISTRQKDVNFPFSL